MRTLLFSNRYASLVRIFTIDGFQKPFCRLVALAAICSSSVANGGQVLELENRTHADNIETPWYIGIRALAGGSDENTSFHTLPDGATGASEDSYNPQENCGAELMLGYHFMAWRLPVRAELSAGMIFRHDADMEVAGLANPFYENNLRIWDARFSLLADVADFGWGRFYLGVGLGAALMESDVTIKGLDESADNNEWKISPSFQAGIIFDDVIGKADFELGYRFRWFGDTDSETFSDNGKIDYEDAHVHEVTLGIIFPLGR